MWGKAERRKARGGRAEGGWAARPRREEAEGGGTEVELLEGGDGAAAGKLRGGGGTAGLWGCGGAATGRDGRRRWDGRGEGLWRGGADFFQRRGLNYPRKIRRMGVKNIEKLESEFRQFLVKTQKIANEIFEVLGKFSRSQSKFGIAWTKFKVVSGLRPRPPAHPKKKTGFCTRLKSRTDIGKKRGSTVAYTRFLGYARL